MSTTPADSDFGEDPQPDYGDYFSKALSWLDEKWPEPRPCPICRTNGWRVLPPGDLDLRSGRNDRPENVTYTLVPVVCENCAYMVWFNAVHSRVYVDEILPNPDSRDGEVGE